MHRYRPWLIISCFMVFGCTEEFDLSIESGWSAEAAWTLGSRLLVIGGSDTLPGHDLFRVRSPVRTRDGHVILADGSTNEVRVFDEGGILVTTFGGTGGGPEEFGAVARLFVLPPDTIMTLDVGNSRIGFWSMSGSLLSSVNLRLDVRPDILQRMTDGSFLGVLRPRTQRLPLGEVWVDSMTLIRIAANGQSSSSLGSFPYLTMYAGPSPRGPGPMYQGLPLEPTGSLVAHDSAIYFGYGSGWKIARFYPDGTPMDTLRRSIRREVFTDEMKDLWLEGLAMRGQPSERAELREFFSSFPTPDSLPAYDRIMLDNTKHLWVRGYPPPGSTIHEWSIFSPEGARLGVVTLPSDVQPAHIGSDFIVALVPGADDVEQVVVYALHRGRQTQ